MKEFLPLILMTVMLFVASCNGRATGKREADTGTGRGKKKDCSNVSCFAIPSDLICVYRDPCRLHPDAICKPHEPNCCNEKWVLPNSTVPVRGCGMEEEDDYY
ncbi:uncharacterized protein LOC135489043 [Lineus longissimus]|uniref:uncharacterized protein LOC135489043 n=1 Tax=Lineus longissimus TaxID=88925 RepID=UPI002B4F4D31